MTNLYGRTNIRTKQFLLQSPDICSTDELNAFLDEYDGNIIDIQIAAQAMGQVFALVIYRFRSDYL